MKKVIRNSAVLLFLFFNICLMSNYASAEIPKDAVQWRKNQHYYAVIEKEMNPVQANKYCKRHGGYLATVSSEKENAFIWKLARKSSDTSYILGGTDVKEEGVWKWLNGEPWKYTNWHSGEPNNGLGRGQGYLQMYRSDGTWDDFYGAWDNYTEKSFFICEWSGKLKLSESLVTLGVRENKVLTYTFTAPDGSLEDPAVTWKTSDGSVAKVSSKGKVVAVSPGKCTITCSANKISQKVSVIVLPKKITGLKTLARSEKDVRLTWEVQPGVRKYEVYMYDPDLEEYTLMKTVSGKKHSVSITGLERKTQYSFKIRAYISSGSKKYYGSYSKVLKVTTK